MRQTTDISNNGKEHTKKNTWGIPLASGVVLHNVHSKRLPSGVEPRTRKKGATSLRYLTILLLLLYPLTEGALLSWLALPGRQKEEETHAAWVLEPSLLHTRALGGFYKEPRTRYTITVPTGGLVTPQKQRRYCFRRRTRAK